MNGSSLARIYEMVRKELLQLSRDPRLYRVIFVAPVIQLVIFGYAVSTDVRHTATFLVDHDRSQASRELVESFTASGYFDVVAGSERPQDLVDALDHGTALMALVIPPGFAADLAAGRGRVQLLFDGTSSNVATVALGYAERIVQSHGLAASVDPPRPAIDLRDRAWFNPDLASRDYNVPAVMGAIILLVCQLLTSLAVVREREVGTLEQLMVTPLKPFELIAGKTIPFAMVGLVDLTLVTTVAMAWFGVPMRGNLLLLLLATLLFLLPGLGIGLLISTISKTQQEAFMSSFLIFMPTMLLSGFMFPVASMPRLFRDLTLLNPLRHYLEIVRGIFLKGVGIEALWPQHLALAALGVVILGLAASRFSKRLA